MTGSSTRRRVHSRPTPDRTARPVLEGLEDRLLLYSTTGAQWTNPVAITYSIVPDGTSIGGTPSNLNQALAGKPGWTQQIQKAAAVWEAVAGVNLVQVGDSGDPIGTAGDQQGDPRFGDIRIGGMAQSSGQLAFAYAPPPFNGGTDAGDIFFNTAQSWQTNGTTYDLLTVAIHEFGHALGMAHSAITTACMYGNYTGTKQAITSDDMSGIDTVYGARQPDAFDAVASNNSSKYATAISSSINSLGQVSLANLDVTTSNDVDWYQVSVPAVTTGTMTVTMQSTSLSSLTPGLTVYNASLASAGSATGSKFGDTVRVSVSGVKPGQVWYIKAMAGVTGPAGVGAYGLQINFGTSALAPIPMPNTIVAEQADLNPTTSSMGTGWVIHGHFTPFDGDPDGNPGHDDGGLSRVTVGDLQGYGDDLTVDEVGAAAGHAGGVVAHEGRTPAAPGPVQPLLPPTWTGLGGVEARWAAVQTLLLRRDALTPHTVLRLRAVDATLAGMAERGIRASHRLQNEALRRSPAAPSVHEP